MGQSVEGFDCSGFVKFVLLQSGFSIPDFIAMDGTQRSIRHANEFWDHYGAHIQTLPEAGDLVFFSRHGLFPTHIGIMRDEESYIHAPGRDGTKVVVEDIVPESIPARSSEERVLFTANPIGYKALTIAHPSPTYRHHQQLSN